MQVHFVDESININKIKFTNAKDTICSYKCLIPREWEKHFHIHASYKLY